MEGSAGRGPFLFWLRLTGIVLVPAVAARFYPPLAVALGIIAPLPLAYGMARRGFLEGLLAVSASSLAVGLLLGSSTAALGFLLETAPLCAAVVWSLRSRLPSWIPVLGGAGAIALLFLLWVAVSSAVTGMPFSQAWWETVDPFGLLSRPSPALDQPGMEQAREQISWAIALLKRLYTGIWIVSLILFLLFYTLITRAMLIQQGHLDAGETSTMARWSIPFPFVGAFLLLGAAVLWGRGAVREAGANALIPLVTLYGIQGMALTGHLFAVWNIHPAMRFLLLFILFYLLPQVLILGLVLMGLFDTWFDFRRRFRPAGTPPPAE